MSSRPARIFPLFAVATRQNALHQQQQQQVDQLDDTSTVATRVSTAAVAPIRQYEQPLTTTTFPQITAAATPVVPFQITCNLQPILPAHSLMGGLKSLWELPRYLEKDIPPFHEDGLEVYLYLSLIQDEDLRQQWAAPDKRRQIGLYLKAKHAEDNGIKNPSNPFLNTLWYREPRIVKATPSDNPFKEMHDSLKRWKKERARAKNPHLPQISLTATNTAITPVNRTTTTSANVSVTTVPCQPHTNTCHITYEERMYSYNAALQKNLHQLLQHPEQEAHALEQQQRLVEVTESIKRKKRKVTKQHTDFVASHCKKKKERRNDSPSLITNPSSSYSIVLN